MKYVIASIACIVLSPFSVCLANNVPSNSLQVEYQQQEDAAIAQLTLNDLYHIPATTYQYLDDVFTTFYNKLIFKTTIADDTFKHNAHYELLSIPLIAQNKRGFQLELFGHFSDPATQQLSNCSTDQVLHSYYSNTEQLDINDTDFSMGAGFSFNTGEESKVKVIISNSEMPGYGSSNALVGFQTRF